MSVGDSAEEFISIHALGRERLLVLSCGLPSHSLKNLFFARWVTIEFMSQFFSHQPPNVLLTEAWSAPATDHRPQSERCTPRGSRSP